MSPWHRLGCVTVRTEVEAFCRLGTLPSERDNTEDGDEAFEAVERRLHAISAPVTDEEARLLMGCFGDDNCFGLAWTLLHLVESAPSPLVVSEPPPGTNEWVVRLWHRYRNARSDWSYVQDHLAGPAALRAGEL